MVYFYKDLFFSVFNLRIFFFGVVLDIFNPFIIPVLINSDWLFIVIGEHNLSLTFIFFFLKEVVCDEIYTIGSLFKSGREVFLYSWTIYNFYVFRLLSNFFRFARRDFEVMALDCLKDYNLLFFSLSYLDFKAEFLKCSTIFYCIDFLLSCKDSKFYSCWY